MIPKVAAALHKLAKPVTSATPQAGIGDKGQNQGQGQGFKKFKAKPDLKIVPPPIDQPTQVNKVSDLPVHAKGPVDLPPSVASVLLHLFQQLQKQRESVLRWLGSATYKSVARKQKNEKSKKGVMLDSDA